jgi:hypothetical protein
MVAKGGAIALELEVALGLALAAALADGEPFTLRRFVLGPSLAQAGGNGGRPPRGGPVPPPNAGIRVAFNPARHGTAIGLDHPFPNRLGAGRVGVSHRRAPIGAVIPPNHRGGTRPVAGFSQGLEPLKFVSKHETQCP